MKGTEIPAKEPPDDSDKENVPPGSINKPRNLLSLVYR